MPSINVRIRKVKDLRRRRITAYRAHLDTVNQYGASLGESELFGQGKTPQEAVNALHVKVSHALNNCLNLTADVFTFRGYTAVLFVTTLEPDTQGKTQWGYKLVDPHGQVGCEYSGGTYQHVRRSAELHIAQHLYPDTDVFRVFTSKEAEQDHTCWLRFQERYQAAKDAGYGSNDCHNYAGMNPSLPKEWFDEVTRRIESTRETAQALKDVQS